VPQKTDHRRETGGKGEKVPRCGPGSSALRKGVRAHRSGGDAGGTENTCLEQGQICARSSWLRMCEVRRKTAWRMHREIATADLQGRWPAPHDREGRG
jgi:hypothetical protein